VKGSEGRPPLPTQPILKKINSSPSLKQQEETDKKIEMAEMIDKLQEDISNLKKENTRLKRHSMSSIPFPV